MTTIEGRNRQDIHESEYDAEEGGHLPEHIPIPHGWEKTAYRSESTQRLSTIGGKYVFKVIDIRRQYIPTIFNARGDTF